MTECRPVVLFPGTVFVMPYMTECRPVVLFQARCSLCRICMTECRPVVLFSGTVFDIAVHVVNSALLYRLLSVRVAVGGAVFALLMVRVVLFNPRLAWTSKVGRAPFPGLRWCATLVNHIQCSLK